MDTGEYPTVWCALCEAAFTPAQVAVARVCPACGTACLPCAFNQDVTVRINWHELRLLVEAAVRLSSGEPDLERRALFGMIARRLEAQRPQASRFLPLPGL